MKKPQSTKTGAELGNERSKIKDFQTQMKITFAAFKVPKTMLMVSVETGILRANICRYIAHWQRSGQIVKLQDGVCPISKCRSGFYSTESKLFPPELQLKMWQK